MPGTFALVDGARAGRLPVFRPVNSVALWTSWMTGVDPSAHGLPDFVIPAGPPGYVRLATATDRAAPALWDVAARRGARCAIFNVPGTWPAEDIPGVMIAGAPSLSPDRMTAPARVSARLAEALDGYAGDLAFDAPGEAGRAAIDSMTAMLRQQIRIADALAAEAWDIYAAIVTATDRLLHFHWPQISAGQVDAPLRAAFADIDAFVQSFVREWSGRADVLLLADHGFTTCRHTFHLADWLAARGWFVRREAETRMPGLIDFARVDAAASRWIPAPASSAGLWYGPAADPARRERDLAELRDALARVVDPTGEPVFEHVIDRRGIATGRFASRIPDVLLVSRGESIALTSKPGPELFSTPLRSGTHSAFASWVHFGGRASDAFGWETPIRLAGEI